MRHPRRRSLLWLAAPFLAVASSSCHPSGKVTHPRESQNDRLNGLFSRSRIVLTSDKKYGEVHIPFTLRDGGIYLKMIWVGRPVEALLDTGSEFTGWPQSLHLVGVKTGLPQEGDMAADVVTHGEWTVLSSIKGGNCEWQDIPTVAAGEMKLAAPSKTTRLTLKTVTSPAPILGASAFQNVVLTIDYHKKEIVIRSLAYDVACLPRRPHDLLLKPEWLNGFLPVLHGYLRGRPARFGLDTGCSGMPISARFAERLPTSLHAGMTYMNINGSSVSVPRLKPLPGNLEGLHFIDYYPTATSIPTNVDALAGTGFLQTYRVTFDYSRGRILLQPYK